MKHITLSTVLFLISMSAFSQLRFGAGATLLFDGTTIGVSGKAKYTVDDQYAGQATYSYFIEDGNLWALDLDVHYSGFELGDIEGFHLTPFGGLNIFSVSVEGGGDTEIGINLGLNATMPFSDSMDLYIEPKIILGGVSSVALSGGFYF